MKKLLLLLIVGIFLVVTISAEVQTFGTFKQNESVNLIQTCGTCTFNQLTSITLPDSTIVTFNTNMDKDGTFYNFTVNETNHEQLGEYIVNGVGDLDGVNTSWNYNYFITPSGRNFTTAQGNVSIGILIGALGLAFLFLIIGLKLFQNDATVAIGFLFIVFSIILGIYSLHLSYVFSHDILQYESLTPVTSTIYTIILFSLAGIVIISAALMAVAMIKQLSETVKRKKFGEGFNPITNTYE